MSKILNVIKTLWINLGLMFVISTCVALFYKLMIWYSSLFGFSNEENIQFADFCIQTVMLISLFYNVKFIANKK